MSTELTTRIAQERKEQQKLNKLHQRVADKNNNILNDVNKARTVSNGMCMVYQ
jgi:hypothetical protein